MALDLHVVLVEPQFFARCNTKLCFDEIDAGDQFGHWVFDL